MEICAPQNFNRANGDTVDVHSSCSLGLNLGGALFDLFRCDSSLVCQLNPKRDLTQPLGVNPLERHR